MSSNNVEDSNHPGTNGVLKPWGHVVDIKTPNPAVNSNDNKLLKTLWGADPIPTKTYSSIAKSLALPMLDQPVKSLLMSREIVAKFSTKNRSA